MDYSNQLSSSSLTSVPGFHGPINRNDTERLLKGCSPGIYIIRDSLHFPGDYTLSISGESAIEHYRIMFGNHKNRRLFTIDEETYFNNLSELVAHYTNDADGLCCKLNLPLVKIDKGFKNSVYIDGLMINRDSLIFHEKIGKGEFSEVCRADYNGLDVAVKIIKNRELESLLLEEALIMSKLNHPNLVHLKGISDLDDCICLVTEFMAKGSLVEYLRSRGRCIITNHDQIKFARDVCTGMAYLEERNIVHRDLAARNVLLHESGIAKVSDFGLAIYADSEKMIVNKSHSKLNACEAQENHVSDIGLADSDKANISKIPVKWTAPEALKDHNFSCKSDVWSFGILLWEIYSFGRVPYPRILLNDVLSKLEEGFRMDPPDGCPPQIYKIMTQAWSWRPEERPTFNVISCKLIEMCSTVV